MRSLISTLFVTVVTFACCAAPAPVPPTGVFGLTNTHNWVLIDGKRVDLFPLVPAGLTNYALWSGVEPVSGTLNWGGLDRLAREARASGKRLAYGILTGAHTPAWALEETGTGHWETGTDGKRRFPLPWREEEGKRILNEPLLARWRVTVRAFAAKLRAFPGYGGLIAYVPITGGPAANGLEVMWTAGTWERFKVLGWGKTEDDLLIDYWKACVRIFLDELPELPLGLAVTDVFGCRADGTARRNYCIPREILAFAVAEAQRRNATVMPMGLWVGKTPVLRSEEHPLVKVLLAHRGNAPIGLQGELSTPDSETLKQVLDFAVKQGVAWVELWHSDILRQSYRDMLPPYHESLDSP